MGYEQSYSDEFVDAARRFYLDVLTSEGAIDSALLNERVRYYFPDLAESSGEVTRSRLRILGADFFRIVGVEQPSLATTYQKALDNFVEDEKARQALLDEPT